MRNPRDFGGFLSRMADDISPLVIGRVTGVYGIRGWVKVRSFTRPAGNFVNYSPLLLQAGGNWRESAIEAAQYRGNRLLVKLQGVDSPEQARAYRHCDIGIAAETLPPLPEQQYYWHQLIGMSVFNMQDVMIGSVAEIAETGANDVLVVTTRGEKRILIPLVMGIYVKSVDIASHRIRVDWKVEWQFDRKSE